MTIWKTIVKYFYGRGHTLFTGWHYTENTEKYVNRTKKYIQENARNLKSCKHYT